MVVRNKPGKRAAAIHGVAKYAEKFLWGECHSQAFLALYGIGFTTQFALISNTIERYVPIYETRNRKLGCLTEVLSDPVSYIEGKKKGRMAFPKYVGPADAAFLFALDALIHA